MSDDKKNKNIQANDDGDGGGGRNSSSNEGRTVGGPEAVTIARDNARGLFSRFSGTTDASELLILRTRWHALEI